MQLPADRGHLATERPHDWSHQLDRLDTPGCIELMVADHRTVTDAVAAAATPLARFIEALVTRVNTGGRLIYCGAGTSGRLGVLDASECPPTFNSDPRQVVGVIAGGDSALRRSSEHREDDPRGAAPALAALRLTPADTVLGIAAGGTTPYVVGALPLAKELTGGPDCPSSAMTGLLTCVPDLPPPPGCDHHIGLETGPELLTGSTRLKAGSATKLALNIITTTLFVQQGKVYRNLMVDLRATNHKLVDRAIRILLELFPDLDDRPTAAALLEDADGQLKTAIVMQQCGVDRTRAEERLTRHGGHLRQVLGG